MRKVPIIRNWGAVRALERGLAPRRRQLGFMRLNTLGGFWAGQPAGGGGGGGFGLDAAEFDGTNDLMLRGGNLTGMADGKVGTFSVWIRPRVDDNAGHYLFRMVDTATGQPMFEIVYQAFTNEVNFSSNTTAGAQVIGMSTATNAVSAAVWTHIMGSWNVATPVRQLYVNDVSSVNVSNSTNVNTPFTAVDNCSVGADLDGTTKYDGCMAELWFTTTAIDLSNVTNRRKFITAGLKPENLGANGETPTGTTPKLYQRIADGAAASSFATNLGSGGNFTITGALTVCASSPSD